MWVNRDFYLVFTLMFSRLNGNSEYFKTGMFHTGCLYCPPLFWFPSRSLPWYRTQVVWLHRQSNVTYQDVRNMLLQLPPDKHRKWLNMTVNYTSLKLKICKCLTRFFCENILNSEPYLSMLLRWIPNRPSFNRRYMLKAGFMSFIRTSCNVQTSFRFVSLTNINKAHKP